MKNLLFFLPLLFLCMACHKESMPEPEPELQPKPLRAPEEIDIIDYISKIEYWATPQDTFFPFRNLIRPLPETYHPYRLFFFPNTRIAPDTTVVNLFALPTAAHEAYGRFSYTNNGYLSLTDYREGNMTAGIISPFNDTLLKYIPTITQYEVYGDSLFLFGSSCQFLLLNEGKNEIQYPQKQVKGL